MAATSAPRARTAVPAPSARDQALAFLVRQASDAAANNNPERSDELIRQVLAAEQEPATRSSHDVRMDLLRVAISFFMILGLFAIIGIVVFHPKATGSSAYVSLMSGLAGIALGWLFGSGTTPVPGVTGRSRRRGSGTDANSAS